jgi:leader peptidase (prepilin peptidase)/N-methyltransferase
MHDRPESSRVSRILIVAVFLIVASGGWLILKDIDAIFGAVLAALALWIAVVDLTRFEIPDMANIALFGGGVVWSLQRFGNELGTVEDVAVRSLLAAGLLFAVREIYRKLRHIEGLGLGDVKLAAAGASWLPWSHLVLALFVAALAAIMLVLLRAMLMGERIEAAAAIPFGAFLAPAIWAAWLAQAGSP